ncbi:hypothetical protein JCM19233_4218 [Vibrio astriarenae]|nr:hypothetical protein JCM19233_4218 [Vibrio sp. C7]
MLEINVLTEFLGWCTVLNLGLLALSSVLMSMLRPQIASFHGRVSALSEKELNVAYFRYLSHYKIVTLVFNVVPYLALKIMS